MISYAIKEYALNQVMHLEADITELTSDTGFKPSISFEEGLKETVEFWKNHKKVCIN